MATLTPRENLRRLWRREGFEFVPVQFDLCPAMVEKFQAKYGADRSYEEVFQFPWRAVTTELFVQPFSAWREKFYPECEFLPGTWFDRFGIGHEPTPESMHMTRMYHPMEKFSRLEEFEQFPFPEVTAGEALKAEVAAIQRRGLAATAYMAVTIWETGWYLRGMENLMMDMLTDEPGAYFLFDRITELAVKRSAVYAGAGVDHIHLGDDIGMQSTPMMSLELYRKWLKPRLQRVIAAAKEINPDVLISYHSCGFVLPFIDDLLEVGIDILNPVQPECMDFAEIHRRFGDRLSFWGTLGTQTTLPKGTPEEVYDVVQRNLRIAGPQGGLLAAPTHLVEPEVPWENMEAYVAACREFRF